MNKIDQIKAKIERIVKEILYSDSPRYDASNDNSWRNAVNDIMDIIDSLPSETVDEQFPPLEGLDAVKAKYYDDGFKNGFDEGADWQKEQVIGIIEGRIAEILGDGQPAPILRYELQDIIKRIKED